MANSFVDVQTFQKAGLGFLMNYGPVVKLANKRLENFDTLTAQLGDTVKIRLPIKSTVTNSLVPTLTGDTVDRFSTLTIDKQKSSEMDYSDQEMLFNAKKFISDYGKDLALNLAQSIEADVAANVAPQPYRAFPADGSQIDSSEKLAQAVANFRDFGVGMGQVHGILPTVRIPGIIGKDITQFTLNRNNKYAYDWHLGPFAQALWHESNMLPKHAAGNVGKNGTTLTVVTVDAPNQITFSGAGAGDADAIKKDDILTFQNGVVGQPDLRFMTFNAANVSDQQVQVRATANAAADGGGNVTVTFSPALNDTVGDKDRNINVPVAAGMEVKALGDHRIGMLFVENGLLLGMPRLGETTPYKSYSTPDPETGVSLRVWYGYVAHTAQNLFMYNCIYGSRLVEEYGMRLVFPA